MKVAVVHSISVKFIFKSGGFFRRKQLDRERKNHASVLHTCQEVPVQAFCATLRHIQSSHPFKFVSLQTNSKNLLFVSVSLQNSPNADCLVCLY